ncbi:MAG: hypothetical protein ABI200_03055 [Gaiellales bacterium]
MATTTQTILLMFAILGAVAWIGTVLELELHGQRMRRAEDGDKNVAFAAREARIAKLVTMPGAALVLIAGTWLAVEMDRTIAGYWWLGSLLGLWIVAVMGSLLLRGARLRAVLASAAEHGSDEEDVRWRLRQVLLLARGELLLLVVAVVLVIVQPV